MHTWNEHILLRSCRINVDIPVQRLHDSLSKNFKRLSLSYRLFRFIIHKCFHFCENALPSNMCTLRYSLVSTYKSRTYKTLLALFGKYSELPVISVIS